MLSEKDKEERAFQYDMTKAQVDFEFWFALAIGVLAIGYSLVSYFKDNFPALVATDVLLLLAFLFVVRIYNLKEKRFRDIKKRYIES